MRTFTSGRIPPDAPSPWARRLAELRLAGRAVLDLTDTNPTRSGLSPLAGAAEILARAGSGAYAPDPLGDRPAREAVARAFSGGRARVEPNDVVLTTSTSESYAHLFRLLADPGEAIVAPAPSYPLIEPLARAEGVRVREYRLAFDGTWHLDRASLEAAMPGAKAVIVIEPNNPTGSWLDAEDRAFVESLAERHGAAIVSDEVFGAFPRAGRDAPGGWLDERRVPTFVLGGLSKHCGLPQMKLGWILLAGPERARDEARAGLEWLGDLFLSVSAPVQRALPELLALHGGFAATVGERLARADEVLAGFAHEHPEVTVLPADGGWASILRVSARRDEDAWALELLERGVAVHPGHFYGLAGGAHLVVSAIVEPETLREGLGALAQLL